ncbi:MAG: dephospho-CoA kinase [Candidatus Egerieousia sp.]
MITLGCTGGIGSGKSFVSKFFVRSGIPVYDSDSRTKTLYDEDKELLSGLVRLLGSGIVCDGRLDRKAMASIIFNDAAVMDKIRKFVYPYVMKDFTKWKEGYVGKVPFVVMESAVLLEDEYVRNYVDKVLVVTAPLDVRVARVMERDGATRNEALERISNQWSDDKRVEMADFVICSVEGTDVASEVEKIIGTINR